MQQENIMIGRLGTDPHIRYTPAQLCVAELSVGVKDIVGKGDERQEVTTWMPVTFFGKQAENAERILATGDLVFIKHRIVRREQEVAEGRKRKLLELWGIYWQLIAKAAPKEERPDASPPESGVERSQPPGDRDFNDDIPF